MHLLEVTEEPQEDNDISLGARDRALPFRAMLVYREVNSMKMKMKSIVFSLNTIMIFSDRRDRTRLSSFISRFLSWNRSPSTPRYLREGDCFFLVGENYHNNRESGPNSALPLLVTLVGEKIA